MFKKLITIILFCFISALAFAQTAPKQILSEKEVNSFITNYKQIMATFDTLGSKYDYLFKDIDENGGFESLIKIRKIAAPAEIQDILRKNGLGDNGFEKAMVIMHGVMVVLMEEHINAIAAESGTDPEVAASIKEARDEIKPLKDSINSKDLALLSNKKDELFKLLK